MKNIKTIISYLKPYKKTIFLGVCCLIIVDGLQMIVPKIIQHIIDFMHLPDFSLMTIFKFSVLIIILAVAMSILRYLWRLLFFQNAYKIERKIRNDYYDHLQKLSSKFFQNHNTGKLMAYATNDLRAVRMLFGIGVVLAFDVILMFVATLSLMININFHLTIYAIIPMPIVIFIMIFFGRKLHHLFGKVQKTFATMSDSVQESISGIRVIKSFVREKAYKNRVGEIAFDLMKENLHLTKIWGMFFPAMFAIIGISLLLTLYFGGTKTILGEITIGEFVAFNSYLHMLIWPVIAIGWIVNLFQRGTASLNRIQKIMDEKPEIVDTKKVDKSIKKIDGKIEFRNLTFSYPDNRHIILNGISFSVNCGETLAIVGKTGEGKSTLIKLLTRINNPPENSIFIDNKDIYKVPLSILRKNIAVVTQDIFLFSTSIEENIKFGKSEVSGKEIVNVTELAHFQHEITEFSQKIKSVIGEKGVSLSGGQKQRLAMARALIKNAPILILDDAFSSVDTQTENIILENLQKHNKNKTTLIIAHRISTMQHADKIIVLDKGKIVEKGNHEKLLKSGGLYYDIYQKQRLKEELKI